MSNPQEANSQMEISLQKLIRNAFQSTSMRESEKRKQDWVEGVMQEQQSFSQQDRELCRFDIVPIRGIFS